MRVRCPHCQNPIEVLENAVLSDVQCSTCGSNFNLVADETTQTHHARARTIGHFELVQQLGMGAFGAVWKARDTQLDRVVAIKIPRGKQLDATEAELFFREARAAAQLKHPSIICIHEVGREGSQVYIVCDYVQGANLKEWLSARRPTFRNAAELCSKIALALHHAHEKGVIHRDIKPSNIMMDDQGEPHIMDFGLAKRDVGEITMTMDGRILGTPAYMSPEQALGKSHSVDGRADVYAVGVMLFELLTGELPFRGDKEMLLLQIRTEEPPSPRKLNRRIPRDLETICLKCLEKAPNSRYSNAHELANDLHRFLNGQPTIARPVGILGRAWKWYQRRTIEIAAAMSILTSFFFGLLLIAIVLAWTSALLISGDIKVSYLTTMLVYIGLLAGVPSYVGVRCGLAILNGKSRAIWGTLGTMGYWNVCTLVEIYSKIEIQIMYAQSDAAFRYSPTHPSQIVFALLFDFAVFLWLMICLVVQIHAVIQSYRQKVPSI